MTRSEWLSQYDATKEKFMWFINRYFPKMREILEESRMKEETTKMVSMLNDAWFELPDNRFNIIENPDGWREFLALVEDPPTDD